MWICIFFLAVRYAVFLAGGQDAFPPELLSMDEKKCTVSGTVYKREEREKGPTWYLDTGGRRYIIYDSEKRDFRTGSKIEVTGTFHVFETPSNPGSFDARSYYQRQQIYGSIVPDQITLKENHSSCFREGIYTLRQEWKKRLNACMGERYGAVLSGILLGDKSGMEPETKELYQKNGIAHLLAVSGLHVSFVGLLVYEWLRKRGVSFLISACFGMAILLPYAFMTGFSVSAKRAVIMFAVRMGAQISGRVYDMLTSLFLAAAVILGMTPLYLRDSGFLLSFGAILGIWAGQDMAERYKEAREEREEWEKKEEEQKRGRQAQEKMFALEKKRPIWKRGVLRVWTLLYPGLVIQLLTLPVLLSSYYEFPPYSVFLNIWIIPLMSVVMGAGLMGSACFLICPALAIVPLTAAKAVLVFYEWNCEIMLQLPFSRIVTGEPKLWQIAVYYGCLLALWLCAGRGFPGKRRREGEKGGKGPAACGAGRMLCNVVLCGGAVVVLAGGWSRFDGKLEVTMLDVGQGDGIFIRSPGNMTCLIDGGSTSEEELSRYTLEPFLESRGVSGLDYVFISHGDEDHLSGISEMLDRKKTGVRIKNLVLPDRKVWDAKLTALAGKARKAGTTVKTISRGQKLSDKKGTTLCCLGPGADYKGEKGNEASMVLELKLGRFSMLFTGDLEGEGEKEFLKRAGGECFYTVLKTAHHGAKGGTTEAFLKKVDASLALISAGRDNRYGHPAKETLARLKKRGIPYFCTKECGALTVRTDGKKMAAAKFLE